MNRGQTAVTNAANLSFFMVNLSHYLLAQFRENNPGSGVAEKVLSWRQGTGNREQGTLSRVG